MLEQRELAWPLPSDAPSRKAGPQTAHGVLLRMSASDRAATRKAAAGALGDSGSMEALLLALTDPSPAVRRDATAAVQKAPADTLVEAVLTALLQSDPSQTGRLDATLAALRPTLEGPMMTLLTSQMAPEGRKSAAAYALGRMRCTSAAPVLAELAWTGSPGLALTSANALADLHDPGSVKALAELLSHQDENVRWAAVEGLGMIGGPEAVQALGRVATNPSEPRSIIRQEAVALLGWMGDASAIPALIESMRWDYNVRFPAGAALRRLTGADIANDPADWTAWYTETLRAAAEARQPPPLVPAPKR